MADYRTMYNKLAGTIDSTDRQLQEIILTMRKARQQCEDLLLEAEDATLRFPGQGAEAADHVPNETKGPDGL